MTVSSEKKIFSAEAFNAARIARAARQAKPRQRVMVIEVLSPEQPGGKYFGKFLDAPVVDPSRDAAGNLEIYATALEDVVSSLRNAAQRDAC